jgi:fumarate reductase subunit C
MWREATALAVAARHRPAGACGAWRRGRLHSRAGCRRCSWPSIVFHLVLLVAMVIHTVSWFEIMPKTMPMLFVGGERVSAATITRAGLAAAVAAALALFVLAWMLKP